MIQFFLKASKSYKIPADEDYRFLYLRNKYQESVETLAESLKTVNTSLERRPTPAAAPHHERGGAGADQLRRRGLW